MAVLYRKYRPQSFAEVVGQKHIIQTLQNQVQTGQVAHAYLFTGSRGVGKTSVARIMAKAVNCKFPKDGQPCGACEICNQITQNNFLDLVEIDAASNTGVDNIRELIEHVKFSPSLGKYKVFIIDEVHMLSKGAFNALLKTLEEPPAHAIFILATTEVNKVPVTIVSRTQRFDFKRLSIEDIKSQIVKVLKEENLKLEHDIVTLIAENAEGSVRDALSLLDKVLTLGESATLADCLQLLGITDTVVCERLLDLIARRQAQELPHFFDSLLEKGTDFTVLNRDFLEFLRKVLVVKITAAKPGEKSVGELERKLFDLAGKFSVSELILITRLFLKSYKDLNIAPIQQIPPLLAALEAALRKNENHSAASVELPQNQDVVSSPSVTNNTLVSQGGSDTEKHPTAESVQDSQDHKIFTKDPIVSQVQVQAFWPEVINKVKQINPPLGNLIKNSPIKSISGNTIVLEVKFLFHKQSLENPKNQMLLREVVKKVGNAELQIAAKVAHKKTIQNTDSTQVISDALKIFGGELVE